MLRTVVVTVICCMALNAAAEEKVVAATKKVVAAPKKVAAATENVAAAPKKVVAETEKVVAAPKKVVAATEEVIPMEKVVLTEKVVTTEKKGVDLIIETLQTPETECHEHAAAGDEVIVHYKGLLESGTLFDTSLADGREPIGFTLGIGKVIPGWEQGIKGMCVGEKRKLTIPPHLAYGNPGSPPIIPPDATLIFETELVGLHKVEVDMVKKVFSDVMPMVQLIGMPAMALFVIFYLYRKYKDDSEAAKTAKKTGRKDC